MGSEPDPPKGGGTEKDGPGPAGRETPPKLLPHGKVEPQNPVKPDRPTPPKLLPHGKIESQDAAEPEKKPVQPVKSTPPKLLPHAKDESQDAPATNPVPPPQPTPPSGPRKSALGANRPGKSGSPPKPKPDAPPKPVPLGSIQFQDAATAKPRPPTPAELRARQKIEDREREAQEARQAAEAKRQKQKRILMGSAAAVGVVGLVAGLGYWLLSPDNVTAQCVQEDANGQPVIVPDSYCTGHTPGMNGFFFWGGHQYRYYYGSTGSIGQRPSGGSTSIPSGAHVTTKSGTTIQRGGIGGSGGKGSGGS